ncbi:MAG: hypothetical protein U1E26_11475 [Coriobacteriia bacterium]|nr:hypothetical protein [Coriobacteriia bacterium]
MAWGRTKTEHSGPKRGKGYWGRKAEAKKASNLTRRREDHEAADAVIEQARDGADAFVARAARCVFRSKPITHSARSRSLIPGQADHLFRSEADHFRPPERNRA